MKNECNYKFWAPYPEDHRFVAQQCRMFQMPQRGYRFVANNMLEIPHAPLGATLRVFDYYSSSLKMYNSL
ncbi:MAG: hypothetical protein JWQ30_1171 [Sediminibacterium sp.]|nr:hypothetical protein [Sediminibacterium sp.]